MSVLTLDGGNGPNGGLVISAGLDREQVQLLKDGRYVVMPVELDTGDDMSDSVLNQL